MKYRNTIAGLGLALAGSGTAWAMSLASITPAQPLPESRTSAAPLAMETWSAGSGSLVPLMAAEMPSHHTTPAESPATDTSGVVGKPVDDVGFVKQATESGRKEVAAARDALPQLKNPQLRQVAEMLVRDHGAANERLAKLAESKGWPVPAPRSPEAAAAGTASSDFDARWTADMIAGHEKSVVLYRAQAKAGEDQELRRYASETLPTIEHHLAELKSLQK